MVQRKTHNTMKKIKSLVLLIACMAMFSSNSSAQRWEFGLSGGISNYHGDLAYNVVLGESHPAYGAFIKYNLTDYWSYRPAFMVGTISGSDQNFEEYKLRNLNFTSNIYEFSNVMEFNFLPFGSNVLNKDFTSYVMMGLAVFYHNPKTEYNGEMHELRKLRTEGQAKRYSTVQISIPFGMGVKYNINKNWVIGYEIGWRKTFTDYLDDVSGAYPNLSEHRENYGALSADLADRSKEIAGEPLSTGGEMRGNPAFNDYYFFTNINIAYRYTPITCWPRYRKQYRIK